MRRCALALFAALALPAVAAIPTVQITGNVLLPDLSTPTSGKIRCVLSQPGSAYDGATAQRVAAETTFALGAGGALPVGAKLVPNAIISPVNTVYNCTYDLIQPNGRSRSWTEKWQLPNIASINIGDIPVFLSSNAATVAQTLGAVPTITTTAASGGTAMKVNAGAGICLNADANPPCTVTIYYNSSSGTVVLGGAGMIQPATSCIYSYTAWSSCVDDLPTGDGIGSQTRSLAGSPTPSGCTGSPILSQSCTPNAPTCNAWTYSEWNTCAPTNTQTRTITSASPSGCVGGTPETLTQSCTYNPVEPAGGDVIAHCATDSRRTATGTTYYVCNCDTGAQSGCVAGSDANAGTSAALPKKTFAAAQALFRGMNAGDTVALCKGGAWVNVASTAPHWRNANCTGNLSTPASTCDLRSYTPTWGGSVQPYVDITTTAIDFTSGSGSSGYRFQGINWHGRSTGVGFDTGIRNVSDVLVCANRFDGFNIGLGGMADRLAYVSNTVTNSAGQGYLGASNYGRLESNVFSNNGNNMFDHNIYVSTNVYANGGDHFAVRNNTSTRSGGLAGACGGVHIVAHGQFQDLIIEGNQVSESGTFAQDACWGIGVGRDGEVPDGSTNPEYFRRTVIRNNTVKNIGNVAVQLDNCQNCVVENNLVVGNPAIGSRGIRIGETAPQTGANGTDEDVGSVIVRNNTVYLTGTDSDAIKFTRAGTGGHQSYNNATYALNSSRCQTLGAGVTLAYNAYNACTTTANSTWFVSAGSDFTPGASSPLLNAGTTRGGQAPTTDITGQARDSSPDIGAYERGGGTSGNTITVAQNGSGNYTTIQAAADAATPGANIVIKAGVYHEQVTLTKSGTESAPITIRGENGVYIDGGAWPTPDLPTVNGEGMIKGSGIAYVNLVNLNIRNVNGHAIRLSSPSYVTIQGGSVDHSTDGGIYINAGSSYITIDGVDVGYTNQEGATADSEAISLSGVQRFEVKNCKVHDSGENGIDIKGNSQFGSVHHNDIYHNATMQTGATALYFDQAMDVDIYANKLHDCGPANYCVGFGIEGWSSPHVSQRLKFYNNLIYDVPNESIGFWNNSTNAPDAVWSDIQIVNNTFYNVTGRAFVVNNNAATFFSGTNVFRNNLMVNVMDANSHGVIFGAGVSAFVVDYNIFDTGDQCYSGGTTSTCSTKYPNSLGTANALFTNTTAGSYDFSLQVGSPAVNAGSATLAPATDYAGTTRPTGAAVDIGAYER